MTDNDRFNAEFYKPVFSRDQRLWLCFDTEEQRWALSRYPNFARSVDLGFRWKSRAKGVCVMNIVSGLEFASDDMFHKIEQLNHLFNKASNSAGSSRSQTTHLVIGS